MGNMGSLKSTFEAKHMQLENRSRVVKIKFLIKKVSIKILNHLVDFNNLK